MSEAKTVAKKRLISSLMRWLTRPRVLGRILFILVCLATLVGLFYLVENWRGSRAWAKKQQELEARGIFVDWEKHIPPPVADEQNFALTAFFRPLFDFKPGTQEWRDTNAYYQVREFAKDFDSSEGLGLWTTAERTDFRVWLASYREGATVSGDAGETGSSNPATDVLILLQICDPVLMELREANQRTQARFPVRYEEENLFGILLPHLKVLQRVGRVLQLRALARLELGRTEDALDDLLLLFDIGETVAGEPFLISQLFRHSLYRSGTSVLWEGLVERRWSAEQLRRLEARLGKAEFLPHFRRSVLAEHAAGHRIIELIRTKPGAAEWLDEATGVSVFGGMSLFVRLAPDGWFGFEHVNYAEALTAMPFGQFDRQVGRSDVTAFERTSDSIEDRTHYDHPSVLNHQVMVYVLAPALNKAALRTAHMEVSTSLATIACALERYRLAEGRLPENLAALMPEVQLEVLKDFFSGKPLKYLPAPDGQYTLYSVGWNQTDNGGVADEGAYEGISEKGDWVWRSSD